MPKEFKYKTVFNKQAIVTATHNPKVSRRFAQANLKNLQNLDLPSEVRLEDNVDLIAAVYNAAVINRLNRNDDGIARETAIAIQPLFLHKPQNIDHKRSRVIGHVVKAGWSSFGENKILSDDDIKNIEDPFNLVLGGVIYRLVDEKFADLIIDAADEESDHFREVSASWELGFDDYHIVVGDRDVKNAEIITDPKHINELSKYLRANGGSGKTSENEYIGRLIVGGVGEVLPLGIGFTNQPAAEVEGVEVKDWTDFLTDEELEEEVMGEDLADTIKRAVIEVLKEQKRNGGLLDDKTTEINTTVNVADINTDVELSPRAEEIKKSLKEINEILNASKASTGETIDKLLKIDKDFSASARNLADSMRQVVDNEKDSNLTKNEKNNSQNRKTTVNDINHKETIMAKDKIKTNKDLLALIPEESRASAADFIAEEIERKSEEYKAQVEEKDIALKDASASIDTLTEKLDTTQESIKTIVNKMKIVEDESAAKENARLFQERMSGLDEEFKLSEADRKVISASIRGMDEDSFQKWHEEFATIASDKSKTTIKEKDDELQSKIDEAVAALKDDKGEAEKKEEKTEKKTESKASEDVPEVLDNMKEEKGQEIANATSEKKEDMVSEWAEAFKGSFGDEE